MRSHTLNSPLLCNAFVAIFRANFSPWKAHHLSSQENLWVNIMPFSLWLTTEEQLQLVELLFAMLELFAGGYPWYLLLLDLAHVSMEHGRLATIHTNGAIWATSQVTSNPRVACTIHAYLLRPTRSASKSRHPLNANAMHFTNNFKNHFIEPPKPWPNITKCEELAAQYST